MSFSSVFTLLPDRPQLLNTFTNLGGTWPKYFVLKGRSSSILSPTFSDGVPKPLTIIALQHAKSVNPVRRLL